MNRLKLTFITLAITYSSIFTQTQFGDTLFSFNAGILTPTQDYSLRGVEFADDHFWVTGTNAPFYNHRLYKISADGNTLVDYTSLGSGYHAYADMAYDGEFLYVVDKDSIVQIDLTTGLPTGERIYISFDYLLLQGLAYDPVKDHFWVIPHRNAQLQIITEIDRDGNILNSYPNKISDYTVALSWDTLSPGGPFLWTFSSEPIGFNNRGVMRLFSPAIGAFTGVEIEMQTRSEFVADYPLGMAFTPSLDSNTVTAIALQAGSINVTDGLDWVVIYDADLRDQLIPGPRITVDPNLLQVQVPFGDSLTVPIYIGNLGTTNLGWKSFIENPDTSSLINGQIGDPLFNYNLFDLSLSDTARFSGVAFAKDHFWFAAKIFPDQKLIVKVDREGNLVATYPQPVSLGNGWSAIATDGNYLYGTDTYVINKWSIDSSRSAGVIFTGSITADAMTYDPNQKYFYISNSVGAIKVIDRNGEDVSLLVTSYEIEGLAWDNYSPGGPYLWAWVKDENLSGTNMSAIRLDPETGISTGVSFEGVNIGSFPNSPEAATIYLNYDLNKLVFTGLQKDDSFPSQGASLVGYDLDEVPPPTWINLLHPTLGNTEPQGEDTLVVKFHAMMEDTTAEAVIKIFSNDLIQPVVEIPIIIDMFESRITSINNDNFTPENFALAQNYPNPFNPATTINYQIPTKSNVAIKIFNILGKEISTLVNEEKPAGIYQVYFDASNFPSGVYFYKLQVSDPSNSSRQTFIDAKKMILLK
jgi:hypothetical protein